MRGMSRALGEILSSPLEVAFILMWIGNRVQRIEQFGSCPHTLFGDTDRYETRGASAVGIDLKSSG